MGVEHLSVRQRRVANLLVQERGNVFRGCWIDVDKVQAKVIPIYPADRCSFDFHGWAIISEREAQGNIETRLNRMFALNAHTELRQIGHDTLPYTFPAEIIQDAPSRDTTIGAKHESSMFWFREGRFWCDGHQSLRLVQWLSEKKQHTPKTESGIAHEEANPKEGERVASVGRNVS